MMQSHDSYKLYKVLNFVQMSLHVHSYPKTKTRKHFGGGGVLNKMLSYATVLYITFR